MTSRALLVLTTCANAAEAQALAAELVERRLAACVNTVKDIASTYRWQSKVEQGHESLLLIKTTEDRLAQLEEVIRARSSYDLPEVLAIPVQTGSAQYLDWIAASVADE